MTAYILFLSFWTVFGFFYLTRGRSKDREKEAAYFGHYHDK
jgi:hypothetical protein